MTSAIGIRIYRVSVNRRGHAAPLMLNDKNLKNSVPKFISEFIEKHSAVTQNTELERSWYFEPRGGNESGVFLGYIHYGTYGFESNFVDSETKKQQYHRNINDVEIIPLYYDFWFPEGELFGLVAFQSFQGRSCINMITERVKRIFENENDGVIISFKKMQPCDGAGGAYSAAPVKQLRLIKKVKESDISDSYLQSGNPKNIKFEITMSAQRNGFLGKFGNVLSSMKMGDSGVIIYDGMDFPEAVADVVIGGRRRQVGVLGIDNNAGVIDLTDAVARGPDGHPTFETLRDEVRLLMGDVYKTLSGIRE